jgi:hypothetical protein
VNQSTMEPPEMRRPLTLQDTNMSPMSKKKQNPYTLTSGREGHTPGAMEFTRTPFGANSNARSLVNLSWAALTTPYAMNAGDWGMIAATDDMLTTDPCSHQSFHSVFQD